MNKFLEERLRNTIRDVENFPKPGIIFKDLTTVFKNADLLEMVTDELFEYYRSKGITKVAGVESRGFVFGSTLALKLRSGFVPIRKPGKLPAETIRKEYTLEYGTDAVEIHRDAIEKDDVILLHDDLLATGGTGRAAYDLVSSFNPKAIYVNFIVELAFLKGRNRFDRDTEIYSLIKFNS